MQRSETHWSNVIRRAELRTEKISRCAAVDDIVQQASAFAAPFEASAYNIHGYICDIGCHATVIHTRDRRRFQWLDEVFLAETYWKAEIASCSKSAFVPCAAGVLVQSLVATRSADRTEAAISPIEGSEQRVPVRHQAFLSTTAEKGSSTFYSTQQSRASLQQSRYCCAVDAP